MSTESYSGWGSSSATPHNLPLILFLILRNLIILKIMKGKLY